MQSNQSSCFGRRSYPLAFVILLTGAHVAPVFVAATSVAEEPTMQVYKSPTCGCCSKWIDHLRAAGIHVKATDVKDVTPIKRQNGLPAELASCHTGFVGGYVIEGHVPAEDVLKLLAERPSIAGLAVPRMPIGSPGMEGPNPVAYDVLSFDSKGKTAIFATHQP